MRLIKPEEDYVSIEFNRRERQILKAICLTNVSVPKVVHENECQIGTSSILEFLGELQQLIN